jgi:hypothetical protein
MALADPSRKLFVVHQRQLNPGLNVNTTGYFGKYTKSTKVIAGVLGKEHR